MQFPKIVVLATAISLLPTPTLANRWIPEFKSSQKGAYQRERTTAGGSRSYCVDPLGKKSLELVVPEAKVVHQTASESPSLFVYSEGAAKEPLIFTLVDHDLIEPLVEQSINISEKGYHKITLPPNIKLEPNKVYSWYVAVLCSNDPESFREVLTSTVEYVPPSTELLEKINKTNSPKEKARIYTSESMWYDAINFLNFAQSEVQLTRQK